MPDFFPAGNSEAKDPGSAITHLIGWPIAILAAVPLLIRAAKAPDRIHIVCLAVFILSMIFILIAGTYTTVCIIVIGGIIYALKFPIFNSGCRNFGSREIFHLFVMAGSFCHFIFMYRFVVYIPL